MKYGFLKNSANKILKIKRLDGGLNGSINPNSINDSQLTGCKNVWFSGGSLKTRPGLSCDVSKAKETRILGYSGTNKYKIYNAGLHINGQYNRVATAEVLTDDYAYYCNVFLINESGDYTSIGRLAFLRITSQVFYIPENIIFYTGKSTTGGGIFAMVMLQNDTDSTDRYYEFYEINREFTEWNRVNDFYIPTLYINGRGNKYEIAKSNNKINIATPKILESPNMLNGRFHSYFTSDGYSNSFRLPFTNLASESIVCRIYYNLVDYVQWQINGNVISDTQNFFNQEITMEVDREKGTVYFYNAQGDYAIPAMDMYNENNIKITATKEIEGGINKIIHSTCSLQYGSRIMLSGGESGNEIFVANYDTPLYFPQSSAYKVGDGYSEIIDLSLQDGRIIALKQNSIHSLTFKEGKRINDISLLADNDKTFCESDSFSCYEISKQIGCKNRDCTAVLNNNTIFLGNDGRLYALTALNGDNLICISEKIGKRFEDFKYADFAIAGDNMYLIFKNNSAFVAQFNKNNEWAWYYWEFPQTFKISGGFFSQNLISLLCAGNISELSFIALLNSNNDEFLEYSDDGEIVKSKQKIKSEITTKYFNCPNLYKKIESIYLSLVSRENICIYVNGKQIANIDLKLNDEEFENCEYKSVKFTPYLSFKSSLYVTISSNSGLALGELEINYF